MMSSRLVLATVALLPALAAAAPATCLRTSGDAAARCLAKWTHVVNRCRAAQDAACEAAARADGGALPAALARLDAPVTKACDDDAEAIALGFQSAADVPARARDACADYGDALAQRAWADGASSLSGAFLGCQRQVATQLARVRAITVRAFGPGCYLREAKGLECRRPRRDARVAAARRGARGRIVRACRDRLATLGLGDLDALLDEAVTLARHYAQQVYPPNDLGPTAETGPYPVGVGTLMLTDATRLAVNGMGPRPVTVELYYPSTAEAVQGVPRDVAKVLGVEVAPTNTFRDVARAAERFPLVVFSHGNNGIRFQSVWFATHLASHGYVVAAPDHHGNTFVDTLLGVVDPDVAANRPQDVSFVIDQVLALNAAPSSVLADGIDADRIGVSGHSFGGYTAFALAGGATGFGTFTDPRVRAILPQAPANLFPDAFFATITIPTLVIGGSIDGTTPFPQHQQRPFDQLPSGASIVAAAELLGAGHYTFSDFCEVRRDLLAFLGGFDEACLPKHLPWRHAHDVVSWLALNFFDAVLRDDAAALGRLDPAVVAGIEDLRYERK